MKYRVLPLWQPYASLMVNRNSSNKAYKPFETRSRATKVRGPVLIQATNNWNGTQQSLYLSKPFFDAYSNINGIICLTGKPDKILPFGALIGQVDLIGCGLIRNDGSNVVIDFQDFTMKNIEVDTESDIYHFGDFRDGRYAWICENPKKLHEPIPFKASQGWNFYETDEELKFI